MGTVPNPYTFLLAGLTGLLSVCGLHAAGTEVVAGDGVRRLGWQTFDVPDGLPAAEIFDLIQDTNGHIWMATHSGLCRYDGAVFTSYRHRDGLPSDKVLSLAEGSGQIWIGTDMGLARVDGDQIIDSQMGDRSIQALLADGDNLWIGSDQGLFRVTKAAKGPPELVAAGHNVLTLSLFSGDLWIGTDAGLFSLEAEGVILQRYRELSEGEITSLLADGERLWIGIEDSSQATGLVRLDARGLTRFGEQDGLSGVAAPQDLALDRRGRLWLATKDAGVLIHDRDTTQVVGVRDGLSHNWTQSLLVDREGSVWVGTWGGLSRYDFDQFETWTTRNGLTENRVYDVDEAAEGMILATWGGGVMHFSADRMEGVAGSEVQSDPYVRAVHLDSRDRLWVATRQALDVREHGEWRTVARGDRFLALGEDAAGNIWAGTWDGGGVAVLGEGPPKVYKETDGLASDRVACVLGDANGDVWIGTDGGLSQFHDGKFTNYTVKDGLPYPRVRALARDGGTLWIGTSGGGLAALRGTSITRYTVADGLTYGIIRSLMVDRLGHLWIGTWGGRSQPF